MLTNKPKAFYKDDKVSIVFKDEMLLDSPYSILNASNYIFFDGSSYSSLENFSDSVFSYSKFHVTFSLKEEYSFLDLTVCSIQFFLVETSTYLGVTSSESLATSEKIDLNFLKYIEDLSLGNYTVTSTTYDSILINLPFNIYLSEVFFTDFYIIKNGENYSINSVEIISLNTFILKTSISLFSSSNDTISIHTINNCSTTDIFGSNLNGNDENVVLNMQENEITKVSITSYSNNLLELTSDFKIPILRYDSSDFELIINNTSYSLDGHSSYTLDKMTLRSYIEDVAFDVDSKIFLKGKKSLLTYTLDNRFIPFSNESKVESSIFYPLRGDISYSIDSLLRDYVTLSIIFNKDILATTTKNYYLATLKYAINLKCLKIVFENLGVLYIYGENLEILTKEYTFTSLVNTFNNNLELFFSIASYNFLLSSLSKIRYFSFEIFSNLMANDETLILSSFQCPLTEVITSYITCRKENVNEAWSLLNKKTISKVILVLDSQKDTLTYGNLNGLTEIVGDLYVVTSSDNYGFNVILVNLINLKIIGDIYVLTNDIFSFNFDNCVFNNLFIYN